MSRSSSSKALHGPELYTRIKVEREYYVMKMYFLWGGTLELFLLCVWRVCVVHAARWFSPPLLLYLQHRGLVHVLWQHGIRRGGHDFLSLATLGTVSCALSPSMRTPPIHTSLLSRPFVMAWFVKRWVPVQHIGK